MTCELHDIWPQVKAGEKVPCGHLVRIHVLAGPRVPHVKVQDKEKQLPEPPLVKHAHQI